MFISPMRLPEIRLDICPAIGVSLIDLRTLADSRISKIIQEMRGAGKLVVLDLGMVVLLTTGCQSTGGPAATLTDFGDMEDLRLLFNRDVGYTRLVLLMSPT